MDYKKRLEALKDSREQLIAAELKVLELRKQHPPTIIGYEYTEWGEDEIYAPDPQELTEAKSELSRLQRDVELERRERDYLTVAEELSGRPGKYGMSSDMNQIRIQSLGGGPDYFVCGMPKCTVSTVMSDGMKKSFTSDSFAHALSVLDTLLNLRKA